MKRLYLHLFLFLLIAGSFARCSPPTPSDLGPSKSLTDEGTDDLPPPDQGVNELYPTIGTIPIPSSPSFTTSSLVIYNPDSTGIVAIVGQEGTTDGGNTVVVSPSEPLASLSNPREKNFFSRIRSTIVRSTVIPEAHAEDDPCSAYCDAADVVCAAAEADGSFLAYAPGTLSTSYYVYACAGGALSDAAVETPNRHLLWFVNSPTDLKEADGTIYALTDEEGSGIGLKLDVARENPAVSGDYAAAYEDFIPHGDKFSYDGSYGLLGDMHSAEGVYLQAIDDDGAVIDTGLLSYQPEATAYSVVKYGGGKLYYGVEEKSVNEAYLYWALDKITYYDFSPSRSDHLPFIVPGDTDSHGKALMHTRTVSFDFNAEGWAYVLYQDHNKGYRIRASDGSLMFGGRKPLLLSPSSRHDFREIAVFNESPTGTDRLLLVDASYDTVWVLRANTSSYVLTGMLSPHSGVKVGAGPIAMALNGDRTRAYVLNREDETISVLYLPSNQAQMPVVVATIGLADFAPGKSLTFVPNTLTYQKGILYVSAPGIKGGVAIDADEIAEAVLINY